MTSEDKEPAVEETGLSDDLAAAFDEVTKADTPEEAPAEQPKEEKPAEPEKTEVEETPPETTETEPPAAEVPAEEPTQEEVAPPASWTAESKEMFNGLDPAIQQEVLKREKDFAKGIEKNSQRAKLADEYDQLFTPYKAMLQAEGATNQQALTSLLNTAYQLRSGTPEQKAQLIRQLAQQYGAAMDQVSQNEETDEYVDPDIKALNQRLDTLQQTTQSQIQANQNQQLQTYQQQISDFAADPENKHFEKVKDTMSKLLVGGVVSNLKEAYDKSLYLVDDVRDELNQEQVKASQAERVKKETEAAAKAKKAQGVQLKDEAAGVVGKKDGTMEEDLAAAYDSAEAKAS